MNPYQGDDIDPFSGARDEKTGATNTRPTYASTEGQMDERDLREMKMTKESKGMLKPAAPTSFKEAFRAASNAGDKTFMFKGKKYNTDMASDKKAAPVKPTPAAADKKAAMDKAFGGNAIKALEARNAKKEADRRAALPTGVSFSEDNPRLRRERAEKEAARDRDTDVGMKKGGKIAGYKKGGKIAGYKKGGKIDGCAVRGKTKGRMI
jgi:hypothetical protein